MKELSIEEKAKRYNEAIERAREINNEHKAQPFDVMLKVFPELIAESEDERIKKALIDYFKWNTDNQLLNEFSNREVFAWLEKQSNKAIDSPKNHQDTNNPNGCIVFEDFNGGEGFYKLHLGYLNKKQVEEVEEMIRTWNKESKASNENIKNCIGMCLTDADEQRFKDYNTNLKECLTWLKKQGTPAKLNEEEQNRFAKGVLTSCALSFIDYLDAHKYESKMCVSNGECEDIENAFHNAMWDSLHRYYCKYIVKQGEQKPVVIIPKFRIGDEIKTSNEESLTITKIDEKGYWSEDLFICGFDEECIWDLVKQKHVDKVEPKFKVGDWVIDKQGIVHQIANVIENVTNHTYGYDIVGGGYFNDNTEGVRLWTIQNAKPGDVLCDGTTIFIFKDLLSDGSVMSYCDYDTDSGESDAFCPLAMNLMCSKITPATKEQRNKLEKAITEAGYRWDTDKNGLRKVEQKSTWSGEDDYNLQCCIAKVQSDIDNGRIGTNRELLSWLKSIKDRVQPQPKWSEEDENVINHLLAICAGAKRYRQFAGCSQDDVTKYQTWLKSLRPQPKQEWSEEDERFIKRIHSLLYAINERDFEDIHAWLKSLRPQNIWKPSEEQIEALRLAMGYLSERHNRYAADSLYNGLKSLI